MGSTLGGIISPRNGFFIGTPVFGDSPSEGNMRSQLIAVNNISWPAAPPDPGVVSVLVPRDYLSFFPDGRVAAHTDSYVAWKTLTDTSWRLRNHSYVEYAYGRVLEEFTEAETGGFAAFLHVEVIDGNTLSAGDEIMVHSTNAYFDKPGYVYVRIVKNPATFVDPATAFHDNYVARVL